MKGFYKPLKKLLSYHHWFSGFPLAQTHIFYGKIMTKNEKTPYRAMIRGFINKVGGDLLSHG